MTMYQISFILQRKTVTVVVLVFCVKFLFLVQTIIHELVLKTSWRQKYLTSQVPILSLEGSKIFVLQRHISLNFVTSYLDVELRGLLEILI